MCALPDSDLELAGQLIGGKYRLVRRIDEGGMGTVWEAHNTDLDAPVAVKLIRSYLVGSGAAERLAHEARILARIDHAAVIRVFDCGETEQGAPFIVMELLHGECLADTLNRDRQIDAVRSVSLLLPIVDALHAAHESGIVHRDVKPENIYIADMGAERVQPKVLDFGIARSLVSPSLRLTTDGSLLGSPQYMSPEQARGQGDLDPRTDVWALCVVLYECITGVSPYQGENYNATLRQIIEDEPPSLEQRVGVDPLLSSIVERGLRKNRDDRWPSMRELGTALAQWLFSQGINEDASGLALRSNWLRSGTSSFPPVTTSTSQPPPARERETSAPPATGAHAPVAAAARPSVESEPRLSTAGLSRTFESELGRPRRRALLVAAAALALGIALAARLLSGSGEADLATAPVAAPGLDTAEPTSPPAATPPAKDADQRKAVEEPSDKPAVKRQVRKPRRSAPPPATKSSAPASRRTWRPKAI